MRTRCRACGSALEEVLRLGDFALCGYFPKPDEKVPVEPMGLSHCETCGLVQMSYDYKHNFWQNYGYKSSLNPVMVEHLTKLGEEAAKSVALKPTDTVVDIGGNDGTLLKSLPECKKVLIDPTATSEEFETYREVFNAKNYQGPKAKIVFSIAMFYDLQDPVSFAEQVGQILDIDGIWVFEQSYLPTMVERNAFDTICHEHLEYYTVRSIKNILEMAGLQIIDLSLNDCNGGSIRVTAGHWGGGAWPKIEAIDKKFNHDIDGEFAAFHNRIWKIRTDLRETVFKKEGTVVGYGASTKGNTLLQFCNIRVPLIVDVNPDKWGRVTPGLKIPIVKEAESDSYLVLPWHFRDHFIRKEDRELIFPLPNIEVVPARRP